MTLLDLMNIAKDVYAEDDILGDYYDEKTGKPKKGSGDTLARFVVVEINETYEDDASDEAKLLEAARVMESAKYQLEDVQRKFEELADEL